MASDPILPERKVLCPVCKNERKLNQTPIYAWLTAHSFSTFSLEDRLQRLLKPRRQDSNWACNDCIRHKRVLVADQSKHSYADYWMTVHYYVDMNRICKRCGKDFIFNRFEQQYWWEEAGIHTDAVPQNCYPCRKELRKIKQSHQKLMELLPRINPKDADCMDEIAQAYENIGSKRASEYRRRAANLRKATNPDSSQ